MTFQLRALTELEDKSDADVDPLAFADLGIGDELKIRAYLDGSTVVAERGSRIRLHDTRTGGTACLYMWSGGMSPTISCSQRLMTKNTLSKH